MPTSKVLLGFALLHLCLVLVTPARIPHYQQTQQAHEDFEWNGQQTQEEFVGQETEDLTQQFENIRDEFDQLGQQVESLGQQYEETGQQNIVDFTQEIFKNEDVRHSATTPKQIQISSKAPLTSTTTPAPAKPGRFSISEEVEDIADPIPTSTPKQQLFRPSTSRTTIAATSSTTKAPRSNIQQVAYNPNQRLESTTKQPTIREPAPQNLRPLQRTTTTTKAPRLIIAGEQIVQDSIFESQTEIDEVNVSEELQKSQILAYTSTQRPVTTSKPQTLRGQTYQNLSSPPRTSTSTDATRLAHAYQQIVQVTTKELESDKVTVSEEQQELQKPTFGELTQQRENIKIEKEDRVSVSGEETDRQVPVNANHRDQTAQRRCEGTWRDNVCYESWDSSEEDTVQSIVTTRPQVTSKPIQSTTKTSTTSTTTRPMTSRTTPTVRSTAKVTRPTSTTTLRTTTTTTKTPARLSVSDEEVDEFSPGLIMDRPQQVTQASHEEGQYREKDSKETGQIYYKPEQISQKQSSEETISRQQNQKLISQSSEETGQIYEKPKCLSCISQITEDVGQQRQSEQLIQQSSQTSTRKPIVQTSPKPTTPYRPRRIGQVQQLDVDGSEELGRISSYIRGKVNDEESEENGQQQTQQSNWDLSLGHLAQVVDESYGPQQQTAGVKG